MPHEPHDDDPLCLLPHDPQLQVKLGDSSQRKRLIERDALDAIIDVYQNQIGPQIGAELVASLADPAFKTRLLEDAEAVLAEMKLAGQQGEHVVVVENTEQTHNIVVCTLCSCYPWPLLGIPPSWYKSDAIAAGRFAPACGAGRVCPYVQNDKYQSMGSTAEIHLVLPQRPGETAGLDLQALKNWVTRDSDWDGLPQPPQKQKMHKHLFPSWRVKKPSWLWLIIL